MVYSLKMTIKNILGGKRIMNCPKCGNHYLQAATETNTSGKDFSASKGCCGAILFGPIGVLCGLCGEGRQTRSTTYWMCPNCGHKFRA